MNRNLLTLILVIICINFLRANNTKPILYLVYSEDCSYSQDLLKNTIADQSIQSVLNQKFEYHLVEEKTEQAKLFIERFKITGFPTQIIIRENKSLLAYGSLNLKEELEYLESSEKLKSVFKSFNMGKNGIQKMSPFEKFVFLETTLNYSQTQSKLLLPTKNKSLRECSFKLNPNRYVCGGAGGASYTFIEEFENPDEFKVAVFHPTEKSANSSVIVSSFVENGKVTQQSRCFYNSQWNKQEIVNEGHYIIRRMECYVATAELCSIIDELKTKEDLENEERFERFLIVFKSPKYKKELLEAYKFNYNKSFLNVNRDETFEFYSNLDKQFYKIDKDTENLKFPEFAKYEIDLWKDETEKYKSIYELINESENIWDVYSKSNALFLRVYLEPCKNLLLNKIMAESKS